MAPGPGVRSIAEVYMHLAIANQYLLIQVGAKPSVDPTTLGKEPERSITEKAAVIKFLKESFDAVRAACSRGSEVRGPFAIVTPGCMGAYCPHPPPTGA